MTETPAFSEWCILELMGHRRLAGLVTEQQIAGHGFLRLDVPGVCDSGVPIQYCSLHGSQCLAVGHEPTGVTGPHPRWEATQFYSPTSVYCITPTTEENARKIAASNRPAPATRWELEKAPADDDIPRYGRAMPDPDDLDDDDDLPYADGF